MKKRYFWKIVFVIVLVFVIGSVVMLLWNILIPSIFGLGTINFWQAVGLLILSRLLFGGLGHKWGRPRHHHHGFSEEEKHSFHEKWRKMNPEERRRFIEKRRRFGFGRSFGHNINEDINHGSGEQK